MLTEKQKAKVRQVFWPYLCHIYFIDGFDDYYVIKAKIKINILPITFNNYLRVADYREEARIVEYRNKLMNNEIGFFAEHEGKMVGSAWASINKTKVSHVVRTFIKLMPDEALLHDFFVNEKFRGNRIIPEMVSNMCTILLKEYKLKRLIIDINVKNNKSLNAAKALGWRIRQKMFFLALFGKPVLRIVVKNFT